MMKGDTHQEEADCYRRHRKGKIDDLTPSISRQKRIKWKEREKKIPRRKRSGRRKRLFQAKKKFWEERKRKK